VLYGVVGRERYDGGCKCGFSENGVPKPVGVLCMYMSRNFSVQLSSVSDVNRSLGCMELG